MLDTDQDGQISAQELKAIDKDGDGEIDRDELMAALQSAGFETTCDEYAFIDAILEQAGDADHDQHLTVQEINATQAMKRARTKTVSN